jgi:hypothetical protein
MTPSQIDAISATSAQNLSAQNSDYVDLADQPLFHKTDATFDRFVAISHVGTQGQACAAPIRIQSSIRALKRARGQRASPVERAGLELLIQALSH